MNFNAKKAKAIPQPRQTISLLMRHLDELQCQKGKGNSVTASNDFSANATCGGRLSTAPAVSEIIRLRKRAMSKQIKYSLRRNFVIEGHALCGSARPWGRQAHYSA
jgi:hypothetical protein